MDQIRLIFRKYVDGRCTDEELKILEEFIEDEGNDLEFTRLLDEFAGDIQSDENLAGLINNPPGKRAERSFNQIFQRIEQREQNQREKAPYVFLKSAVLMIIVAIGAWLVLDTYRDNVAENVVWVEKSTQVGQKSTITLKDGSNVILNSESRLRFPEKFGDTREVILEGEAFFMVRKNEKKPFLVRSGSLVTTVLGTSFNVRAYPEDSSIHVAVATGKVAVSAGTENRQSLLHLLEPGHIATYKTLDGRITIESKDINELIAWREGILKFHTAPFREIKKTLERWYGMPIILANPKLADCIVTLESKNESLENVLKALQFIMDIEYEFFEDRVVLYGNGCE